MPAFPRPPLGPVWLGRRRPLRPSTQRPRFLDRVRDVAGHAYADAYLGLRDVLVELFGREVYLLTEPALENSYLRSAVERQFEIVGEVFVGLRRVDPDLAATIPVLSRIVAFRNVLIHGYTTVDDRLVWGVVEGKLPELLARFTRLLDEAGEGGPGGV